MLSRREALARMAPKAVTLHEGAEADAGEKAIELTPMFKDKAVFCLFLDDGAAVTITVKNYDAKSGKDGDVVVNFGVQTADVTVWKHPADYTANKILANNIKVTWDKACTFTLTAHI